MAKTYELICEGACNHNLPARLDSIAERERRTMQLPTLATIAAFKRLKHTPHVALQTPDDCACLDCGTVRRFGATTSARYEAPAAAEERDAVRP